MNLNDKNIDQIFRDAAQNSDAPRYDSSYWKEMSSVLSDQDKRKRGFILWSIAGSIVAVLLVSALFVTNNKNSDSLIANNQGVSSHGSQNSVENERLNKTISSKKSTVKADEQKVGTGEIYKSQNNYNQSNNLTSSASIENASYGSQKNLYDSSNDLISSKGKTKHIDKPQMVAVKTNKVDLDKRTVKENKIEDLLESNDNLLVESLSPKMITTEKLNIENELVPFKLLKENPFNFYTKLSAGLMENYETSRPFQSGVFDLSLNLEYVKNQVLIRTGIGFQATSNADLVVSERAKVYGFGITTHQNNLSYQSLYDIYIPLELGYTLNNTSFGFGTQVNYMLGTTMNFESLENEIVVDEYKLKGFDGGLNTFTAQGYVWLEQKISNRFAAGVKVGTNLNSRIKEGKYFNESATTNPLYGQLTLRYNLNK